MTASRFLLTLTLLSCSLSSLLPLTHGQVPSFFTSSQTLSVPYAGPSGAQNLSLSNALEPTCLVDYAAVWARSASVEMWAISGGQDYENDNAVVVKSFDGFNTITRTIPTYTVANAILRNRRAGGVVKFVNGSAYNGTTVFMWGGNTDEDVGDAAIYTTQDDFATIQRPRTTAVPSPCPWAPCTTSPQYARFAYTGLPFTNYLIQAGGGGNGVTGTNTVYISTNQGNQWVSSTGPFPPFLSGTMVALFDSVSVPNSGSTNAYSTVVLVVPAYPQSTVWSSSTGGTSWTQVSTAPWAINVEVGSRMGMAMAVDADNHVYLTGGSTATADLWLSPDKGVTWSQIPISGSTYAASYGSCMGVRYTGGSTAPTLVLFSGQIYSSLALTGTGSYAIPAPSTYALNFALTAATSAPVANSAAPAAVYPGATTPSSYFLISYSQSPLYQLQYGTAYTVCFSGQFTATPHPLFGVCTVSNPCQQLLSMSGTRVFANQTTYQSLNITGLYNGGNITTNNFIFPLTTAKVDYEGLYFTLSGLPYFNGFTRTAATVNLYQVDDTQKFYVDSGVVSTDPNIAGIFNISQTPFPASACPTTVLPPPAGIISSGVLPRILSTIDCSLQTGTVQVGGTAGGLCPASVVNLGINLVVTGVTSPFYVQLVSPTGATALCTTPALNQTNSSLPQQIACFPSASFVSNAWIGTQVRTTAGYSNVFPSLLFNTQTAAPWPPAIYTVSGSGCVAAPTLVQQAYGYKAVECPTASTLTVTGDFFDATTIVYVSGLPCASQSLVSSTSITCTTPASIVAAVGSGASQRFSLYANNTVGTTIVFQGLYLGAAPNNFFTAAQTTAVPYTVASGTNLALNLTFEPSCYQDYAAVWARSSSVEMWAISGGGSWSSDNTVVVHSSDGFATSVRTIPTYTVANAILRPRRAGGVVRFINGSTYNGTTVFMWGGLSDEDVGDAAIYTTQDDFATIQRPRTNAVPSPCPSAPCTASPVYARFAYAVLPFTNRIVQVGGGGNGVTGTNTIYISQNQGNDWYTVGSATIPGPTPPFPPFLSGAMVALFDSAAVPGSGSTAQFSTLVLVVPAYPQSTVWQSTTGGVTWGAAGPAPWAINMEVGSRVGIAMTVDADNNVYLTGGNTATADLWVSADKGSTWSLIPISSSTYAASYGSCLGVRYSVGVTAPSLVLYSGAIYTSVATVGTGALAAPAPSTYALTFSLTGASTQPLPNTAAPAPVYPGTTTPSYYFQIQYSQSALYQLQYGRAYSVCVTGQLMVTPHLLFGACTPSNPCQQVRSVSGSRTFTNQSVSVTTTITGLSTSNPYNDTYNAFIFPNAPAKVDAEGLGFTYASTIPTDTGTGGTSSTFYQFDDTQALFLDSAFAGADPNVAGTFSLSTTTPFAACPTAVLSAPTPLPTTGSLPAVLSTIDCSQQVGTTFVGSSPGQCPQSVSGLSVNFVVSGVTSPFLVQLSGPSGATASCTSPALNQTNPNLPQQVACFPGNPGTGGLGSAWIGAQVKTLAGNSNIFPALLFSTQNTAPWPPAVYKVQQGGSTGCVSASTAVQQTWGYLAVVCPSSATTPLTINGEWFDASTIVSVGGMPCASQTLVSSNVITCVQPASVVSATASGYAQQFGVRVNNTVGISLVFQGLWIGTAPPSTTTGGGGGGGGSSLSGGAIAGIVVGVVLGVALLCCVLAFVFLSLSKKEGGSKQLNDGDGSEQSTVRGTGREVELAEV